MKPEIKKMELSGSKNWSVQKSNFWSSQQRSLTAITKEGQNILTVRWHYTKSGTCHALVQVWGERYSVGFGRATGYGYEKSSSAVWEAFRDAGIDIENLNGSGQVRDAVDTVAIALAGENFLTTVSV